MSRAAEFYRAQVDRQRLHHQERLEWLSQNCPCWACGEPLTLADVRELTRLSRVWLDENRRRAA